MAKKIVKKSPPSKVAKKSQPIRQVPSPAGFDLCPIGIAYWERIAPQLVEINLLTELHLETFAELCRTYGEYRTLTKWLIEDPSRATFTSESGYESESPQVRMREKALTTLQKLWPKFGLHPFSLAQMRKHGGIPSNKGAAIQAFAHRKYDR
ncbi:Phage terminase, small subunit [Pirellula sp. SH-Sr6A]|uniref:P27 family phage terminase small subunit n=1 Tax=Pirellula sp. SH-Sr6A TaxID=1632865 RepID=UPI00078C1549|nr:P27 family phage terminase small subunit [Pirellula sp. SH-Sr6A]AMV34566.1 Phage terminase, small subunit [Pirellula sp. SH-Sr6A]